MGAPRTARRGTVRLRIALLYGALTTVSGACLLGLVFLLIVHYSPTDFITWQPVTGAPTGGGGSLGGSPPQRLPGNGSVQWTGLGRMVTVSGIALAIMAAVSVVVGGLVAGRMLRPLRTMTATARRISERNLHERLAVTGPRDELKELGDTIDGLLGRLEAVVGSQRQFAANASHELRTPLTLERTLLEAALSHPNPTAQRWRATCERVLASVERQGRLIEALLILARSQRQLQHPETFDLAAVAGGAVRSMAGDASNRGVFLRTTLAPGRVSGDPGLVERLVSNLLENAIRYNVPGGAVSVAVGVAPDGEVQLRVTNTGPTVPVEQVDRLLQPFQRLGKQRAGDGVGLGLSIVAAIAQAHGATLDARPGPDGGLEVRVTFHDGPEAQR